MLGVCGVYPKSLTLDGGIYVVQMMLNSFFIIITFF